MAKTKNIGSVIKKKDGNGVYIKIDGGPGFNDGDVVVSLKHGDFVNVDDPRTLPAKLLELGAITESVYEKMAEQAAKTPDFVKFRLSVKA